ncbi:MAG: thioesterase family protein [Gammaproteobacteria bacterium]
MNDPQSLAAAIDAADWSAFRVLPAYIDGNGHMNVGYYAVLFDQALDIPWKLLGIDYSLIDRENKSSFALESHYTYRREVREGDALAFTFRLLDFDAKRVHYFMTMQHAAEGWMAATSEQISMCVDMGSRRGTNWPADVTARLEGLLPLYRARPGPPEVGRLIGIRRRTGAG